MSLSPFPKRERVKWWMKIELEKEMKNLPLKSLKINLCMSQVILYSHTWKNNENFIRMLHKNMTNRLYFVSSEKYFKFLIRIVLF